MKGFSILIICYLFVFTAAFAQSLSLPPSGDNQKCSITQWIGLVSVNITYNSPDVTGPNGEDRRGKIWGGVVPYGLADNTFGTASKMPWRAGANENTTITFSHNVKIEGSDIAAGTYGIHMIPEPDLFTIIFSKDAGSWGSYFYDSKRDALRVTVKPVKGSYTEWLSFDFIEKKPNFTIAALKWEEMMIPFKIEADFNAIYLAKIREELKNAQGFDWKNWVAAIQFCVSNNMNLEEALLWSDYAIEAPFVGEKNFETMTAKSMVLLLLDRQKEAENTMSAAMDDPSSSMINIHNFGRKLISIGQADQALKVFQMNRSKYPDDNFTTYVGLARGYEASGKLKQARKNYLIAAENAPEGQKAYYTALANGLE